MRKTLLVAAVLIAALTGCDGIANRGTPAGTPEPPVAAPGGPGGPATAGGPIRVDFEAHAYDPTGIEFPTTFVATTSVIGVNGREGKYESPPGSGTFVPGPRVESKVTPFATYAEFGPDILHVSFSAAATIPSGGALECRAYVNGVPVAQDRQRAPAATPIVGVPLVVSCVYP